MLPSKIAVCRTADEWVDCHGYGLILPGNVRDLSCPATSDVPHNNSNPRRPAKAATADLRRRRLPLFASRSALRIAAQRNTGSASEPPPIGAPPTVGVGSRRGAIGEVTEVRSRTAVAAEAGAAAACSAARFAGDHSDLFRIEAGAAQVGIRCRRIAGRMPMGCGRSRWLWAVLRLTS